MTARRIGITEGLKQKKNSQVHAKVLRFEWVRCY